jgi:hypothetical protein
MAICPCTWQQKAVTDICRMLLDAAPESATSASVHGMLPMHWAARHGHPATCRLLLDRAPHTAVVLDSAGMTPLQLALARNPPHLVTARCVVAAGPSADVLAALSAVPEAQPLFAGFLLARSPHLTSKGWTAAWSAVPAPCQGLLCWPTPQSRHGTWCSTSRQQMCSAYGLRPCALLEPRSRAARCCRHPLCGGCCS